MNELTPEQVEMKLIKDTEVSESHQAAWDNVLLPFFEEYDKNMFLAFQQIPTSDMEALKTLKLQMNVANSLKAHIEHFIATGELAKMQLSELAEQQPERGIH